MPATNLSKLRVVDLKAELSKLSLSTKGKKDELIARLKEAIKEEDASVKEQEESSQQATTTDIPTEETIPEEVPKVRSVPEQVITEQSAVEPVAEVVVEAVTEPAVETVSAPAVETVSAPVVETVPATTAETVVETVVETEIETEIEAEIEQPPTEQLLEDRNEIVQPVQKTNVDSISEITTEATANKTMETAKEPHVVEEQDTPMEEASEVTVEPTSKIEEQSEPIQDIPTEEDQTPQQGESGVKRKREEDEQGEEQFIPFLITVMSADREPESEEEQPAIYLKGFVRPLIIKHVQELIGKYGKVKRFWMDTIKTHCYVVYESVPEAQEALKAIHGLVFPSGSDKTISGGKLTLEQAEHLIEQEQSAAEKRIRLDWELLLQSVLNGTAKASTVSDNARRQRTTGFERINRQLQRAEGNASSVSQLVEAPTKPIAERHQESSQPSSLSLEDLFCKTTAVPPLYYLPVSADMAKKRLEAMKGE
ncbi:hypothetical protein BDF14DRAFT_1745399 [Spinellus fusiger]|nr:hypothetical protein BDF14DRAFT_1745399 [Spinellus fusiger]